MADAASNNPSLARCCGQFVGEVIAACRADVVPPAPVRTVSARMQEETRDGVTYRRIEVDQIVGPTPP